MLFKKITQLGWVIVEDTNKPTVTGVFLLIVGICKKRQSINESQENKFHKVTTEAGYSLSSLPMNQAGPCPLPPGRRSWGVGAAWMVPPMNRARVAESLQRDAMLPRLVSRQLL